ncbi:MAG: hypothetical protein KA715_10145 [Xanthomonadaceae bacterium]|nr:hypothetical protein [Xanthomonadaceae bacterium]
MTVVRPFAALFYVMCALVFTGCSATQSLTGKEAAIFNANQAMSKGDCNTAISLIDPYYNSSQSDNTVRRVRATAYACAANMGFFRTIDALSTNNIVESALWRTLTQTFPSSILTDRRMEAGWIATETLMTWLKPNRIIPAEYAVPTGAFNPGSIYPADRDDNANTLMVFVAMSLIGSTQYRYGKLEAQSYAATYNKLQALPWVTADSVSKDTAGCAYAGAIMNMFDAIEAISSFSSPTISGAFSQITLLKDFFDDACNDACRGLNAGASASGLDYSANGCTMTAAEAASLCTDCPVKLRHRSMCADTSVTIDKNATACAASGIVIMMNDNPILGWPGP